MGRLENISISTNRPSPPHSRVGLSLGSFPKKFTEIVFCDWPKPTRTVMWLKKSISRYKRIPQYGSSC